MADYDSNWASKLSQQMSSGGGGQNPDTPPENIFDALVQSMTKFVGSVTKFVGVNTEKFGQVSVIGDISKAGIQINNPMLKGGGLLPDAQGGATYRMLSEGLQVRNINQFNTGGGGGGDAGGGGGDFITSNSGSHFNDLVGAQGSYDNHGGFAWADVPRMPEGGFRPTGGGPGMAEERGIS